MAALNLYPFTLEDAANNGAAIIGAAHGFSRFSFIFDGERLAEPYCAISHAALGDMGRDPARQAAVTPARAALFGMLGINPAAVCHTGQVHGQEVAFVPANAGGGFFDGVDGIVRARAAAGAEAAVAVTVADCLPVLLLDTKSGALALVHSGWRGTGIAVRALRVMEAECKSRPRDVAAILGPCICGDCYEVDHARFCAYHAEFGGAFPAYPLGPPAREKKDGGTSQYYLDMRAANAAMLAAHGVRNIAYCENCTVRDTRLGSFRREGAGAYTKMLVLSGWPAAGTA
ncbi:MAG: polyphenol oxidase family protein [Spirochaetaceae bacterium]|jgi:YfiH family protein|nr:polyphenol oxidase family protein [Spirochaetaceae bacterium]